MLGRDGQDPLFLQLKEAEASVLEEFLGPSEFANHGQRVVIGQRLMQASSDIFLGWLHVKSGLDGKPRHGHLGQALRLDARPRARPQRGQDRDRRLPRQQRQLRPRDPRILQGLRRAKRTGRGYFRTSGK
jgi:Uncharacterized protein conserved in bacteria (DUF2252)